MKMKNLRKNKKGVSDVIAVLLMIAIAVAASLIAYAWVMGYLGGTTVKIGKVIRIESMVNDTSSGNLTLYVMNVGDGAVTLKDIYINGMLSDSPTFSPNPPILAANQTATIVTSFMPTDPSAPVSVKVVCADGTFIEATSILPGP
jgi:flagellin-like protein